VSRASEVCVIGHLLHLHVIGRTPDEETFFVVAFIIAEKAGAMWLGGRR
jgi:hypothetical protein